MAKLLSVKIKEPLKPKSAANVYTYNLVQNYLELYKVLVHVPFTTIKWNLVSSIYKLPDELLNNLRLRIIGNTEIIAKSQNCMGTQDSVQSPFQK